ncbi:hypothetical protein E3N88_21706 [Mikania micrantha]|uniref:Integrase catalytic domain-containing protein n=1 Tax=Mikania micrantha TaxID=192012 RepID=A0A5N6NAY5_9ASTR|nr:hypothetical protein E3N88_21706 [Mikania micrantha]
MSNKKIKDDGRQGKDHSYQADFVLHTNPEKGPSTSDSERQSPEDSSPVRPQVGSPAQRNSPLSAGEASSSTTGSIFCSPKSTVAGRGPMLPESATRIYGSSDPSVAESETYDDTPTQGTKSLHEIYELLLTEGEPTSFKEAAGNREWERAMETELASIEKNHTWELSDLPSGHRPIGLKWIYKIKRNASGDITERVNPDHSPKLKYRHSRTPFPNQAKFISDEPLDLVYGDLCGPISPPTHSGKKYIFLLVDDCTRYMWVYFLTSKDEAFKTFKEFKLKVENEVGIKLKMLRTDRGGEFTSNEFTQFCKDNGIARQLTAPYSPQQNGVVERRNRTMLSMTRSMLKAMSMPQNFWAEAVRHTIYVLNRVPTKALTDCTPYEALKGRKPNMGSLRVFGCIAYSKVPSQHLTKLDDRSIKMVHLGMEEGSKAYRLFDPITKKIYISRDVKFVEKDSWNWKDYMNDVGSDEPGWIDFVVNQIPTPTTGNSEGESANNEINESEQISSPNSPNTPFTPPTYTFEPNSMEVEYVSGDQRPADILTKALPMIKFTEMREVLGVKLMESNRRNFSTRTSFGSRRGQYPSQQHWVSSNPRTPQQHWATDRHPLSILHIQLFPDGP